MTKSISFTACGSRLKTLRQELGLSPRQMAGHLDISQPAYYKNENGHNFISPDRMAILEKDYDVSMDWLIFGKGPMHYNKEKQRVESMEKELETLKKDRERVSAVEKELAKKLVVDDKPGLRELLAHMEREPVLYHEIMLHFRQFIKNQPPPDTPE